MEVEGMHEDMGLAYGPHMASSMQQKRNDLDNLNNFLKHRVEDSALTCTQQEKAF